MGPGVHRNGESAPRLSSFLHLLCLRNAKQKANTLPARMAFPRPTRRKSQLQSQRPLSLIRAIKNSSGRLDVSTVKLTVNGKAVSVDCEDRTLLVHLLRDHLNLTGTHVGCDTSQCGACVVHIDGRAVKSCTTLAAQAEGANVTTIEGIAKGDQLHPMQAAFRDNHGLQCGFCTPGMIMTSIDIVHRYGGKLDEATVRHELEGNICRCTGYHNIVKAVLDAASRMQVAQAAE
jgi:aerobic carbon-monoxide dehydrogenase small subunit